MDKKELLTSTAKAVLGAVPWIGTALNEALFEYSSRIKQKRLETFVNQVSGEIGRFQESRINKEHLTSEEFVDFFEALLLRVIRNRSEQKLKRFKNIFLRQVQKPTRSDFTETFLDIASSLHEAQISILEAHRKFRGLASQNDYLAHPGKTELTIPNAFEPAEFRTPTYYGVSETEYRFFVQDLISRSLLIDDGMGRFDIRPLQILEITDLGIEFLEFIEEYPD